MENGPQLEYLADLSRIELKEDEAHEFQGQLESILEYMQKLNEVNDDSLEEMSHAIDIRSVLRPDIDEPCDADIKDRLLDDPRVDDEYFIVKKVL